MEHRCYLGHPWCNLHVKPLTEEDYRKGEDALKALDKAYEEGGPVKVLQVAKHLFEE